MVEAEKRTNRASIDSAVFELPHSSFVLEPDYAKIAKRLRLMSQPLIFVGVPQRNAVSIDPKRIIDQF